MAVPHDEVIRARTEQEAEDNQDALRRFVELATWEALDSPDLLNVLLSLLWLWEDIDPTAGFSGHDPHRMMHICGLDVGSA